MTVSCSSLLLFLLLLRAPRSLCAPPPRANYTHLVRTLAGSTALNATLDGLGTAAGFRAPYGLAYSPPRDELYISDIADHRIRVYFPANRSVATLAGSGAAGSSNGVGANATLNTPVAVSYTHLTLPTIYSV